ncbi:MAG TPA: hypothetical protein VFS83_10280 [Ktedonobacterales bacterium]|nr:hypothetical protein [Ktedonobacterales bacterium]
MDQNQEYLLLTLLPAVLTLLLIGLAAGLRTGRWRWTLLIYALIALALYLFSAVVFYIVNVSMFSVRLGLPDASTADMITHLGQYSVLAAIYSVRFGIVSAFLALVLAGRARQWSWFTIILLAAVVSAIAVQFALDLRGIGIFIKDGRRTLEIFSSPLYTIVVNALAMLTLIAQILYATFAARTTATAAPKASTASMSDDPTLP